MPTMFSDAVVTRLRNNAGFNCCAPFCCTPVTFASPDGSGQLVYLGEIAHIYGHGQGSARSRFTPEGFDVHCYENAIQLCRICHRMVDRCPDLFPPQALFAWKQHAEQSSSISSRVQSGLMVNTVDMSMEWAKAYDFLGLFNHFLGFMHDVHWSLPKRKNHFSESTITRVRDEALQCVRSGSAALTMIVALGDGGLRGPRFMFQHPSFRFWVAEIVRCCGIVKNCPEFSYLNNYSQMVDFEYDVITDEDGQDYKLYTYLTAGLMHELKLQIERFNNHLQALMQPASPFFQRPF
ncbi:hypothetical protein WBQ28_10070 [Pseudomonas syringae pv. syringae]|uniref:hypothetical protein n=1 Tax=Pseudomonas syringae TaxID=317 RepID=UPI003AFFB9BB